jgi:glyoxylase-like metal-dependent hydrolase (beta-lactamase superfamily II)
MRVINLSRGSQTYTANVYLVLGTRNAIGDLNTLIDVGRDSRLPEVIEETYTGVGKKKVDQVILTHDHYDHAALLPKIKKLFDPVVYAFSPFLEGVDRVLRDGDLLRIGDSSCEIFHIPGHSSDSVCVFCPKEGILFSGDSPIVGIPADSDYGKEFRRVLRILSEHDVRIIYPGHGEPLEDRCGERIRESLEAAGG